MELAKLIRASGFFLSSAVTISLAIMFFDIIHSTLISLSVFIFIIPLFAGSIILRAFAWKRLYDVSRKVLYFITAALVLVLGFALLIWFLLWVSTQTILYPLSDYAGMSIVIGMSLLWAAYSLAEFVSVYGLFQNKIYNLSKMLLVPIILIEASLVFLAGDFSYALPIGLLILAASTAMIGLGFLFDNPKINSVNSRGPTSSGRLYP